MNIEVNTIAHKYYSMAQVIAKHWVASWRLYIYVVTLVLKGGNKCMNIVEYTTAGGKNLIQEYVDSLSAKEQLEAENIRRAKEYGLKVD